MASYRGKTLKLVLLVATLSTFLTGCMSVNMLSRASKSGDFRTPIVYAGTRYSTRIVGAYARGASARNLSIALAPFLAADLPFTFILDTILLPVTLPWSFYATYLADYDQYYTSTALQFHRSREGFLWVDGDYVYMVFGRKRRSYRAADLQRDSKRRAYIYRGRPVFPLYSSTPDFSPSGLREYWSWRGGGGDKCAVFNTARHFRAICRRYDGRLAIRHYEYRGASERLIISRKTRAPRIPADAVIEFSPDGTRAAVGMQSSNGNLIYLMDSRNGRVLREFSHEPRLNKMVHALEFDRSGRFLFATLGGAYNSSNVIAAFDTGAPSGSNPLRALLPAAHKTYELFVGARGKYYWYTTDRKLVRRTLPRGLVPTEP